MMKNPRKTEFFAIIVMFIFFFGAQAMAAQVKPGDIVDSGNADQYKDYFPSFMNQFIKDGYGLVEPASPLHITDLESPLPPKSYRDASEKNIGKVTLNPEDLTLTGYDYCGLPFPEVKEPHKNEKIIVNFYYRWRGSDFYYEDKYLCASTQQRREGRVTFSNHNSAFICYVGRTAPGFQQDLDNPNGLHWCLVSRFYAPAFKNLRTLQWRYLDPTRDDDMWSYIPTLRRTLRMVSSERANPINGTPLTYDDIYGFDGKLSLFSYQLVDEKKMVGNINFDVVKHYEKNAGGYYEHPIFHGPEYPYGLADIYVIEVTPKIRYPESKKVLYMNKANYMNIYSEVYDKRGELWKGLVFNVAKVNTAAGEEALMNAQCDIDLKSGHWLNVVSNKAVLDVGLSPEIFDPAQFYKW